VMATRSEPNPAQIAAWGGVVKAMDPTEGVAPDGLQTNPWKQDVTKKISSSSGKKVCIGIDRKLVTGSTGVGHFHK